MRSKVQFSFHPSIDVDSHRMLPLYELSRDNIGSGTHGKSGSVSLLKLSVFSSFSDWLLQSWSPALITGSSTNMDEFPGSFFVTWVHTMCHVDPWFRLHGAPWIDGCVFLFDYSSPAADRVTYIYCP